VTATLATDTGTSATDKITSNPALTGTADPNATVHFTVDGTAITATATANASGVWTYTPAGLADGQHTIVASETNAAGQTGNSTLAFQLDKTAPVVTETFSASTATTSAAVAGTAEANGVVKLSIDGSATGSVTADTKGAWSYSLAGVAAGTHAVVAAETDTAGNAGQASLSVTVAAVTSVTDTSATHTTSSPPAVTAPPATDTGASATDKITSSPATSVTDTSATHTTTVDTHGPTLTLNSAVMANGHVTVTGTTGEAGDAVHLYDGSSWIGCVTTAADGTFSYVGTAAAGTTHDYGGFAFDAAGNLGPGSNHVSPTAGTSTATEPATSSTTTTTTPTVDASSEAGTTAGIPSFTAATAANGQAAMTGTTGEAGDAIHIYDGSTWIGWAPTGSDGTWHFTANAGAGEVHTYGVLSIDPAGHVATGSNTLIVGSSGADKLVGGSGGDIIVGNGGNDTITGGGGADKLTGGAGNVTFTYNAASDSSAAAADTITDFHHGSDKVDLTGIAGLTATNGVPQFQGNLGGSGNLTVNAHSLGFLEVGGNTVVLVNTSSASESVSSTDMHAADMKIVMTGINLGLTANDFHHA
jgi:hypothetical protein